MQSQHAKPTASSSSPQTSSEEESPVPYETYLRMSKAEREAIPYERRPYQLTPDEIEDLRQDAKDSSKIMAEEFADVEPIAIPLRR